MGPQYCSHNVIMVDERCGLNYGCLSQFKTMLCISHFMYFVTTHMPCYLIYMYVNFEKQPYFLTKKKKEKNDKKGRQEEEKKNSLLKAIPEEATTKVWMTVFSWRVNGCLRRPQLLRSAVQALIAANPNKPAATLRDGMIPVVKLSLHTMKMKTTLRTKLVTTDLTVICSVHGGTLVFLNASSPFSLLPSSSMSMTDPTPTKNYNSINFHRTTLTLTSRQPTYRIAQLKALHIQGFTEQKKI